MIERKGKAKAKAAKGKPTRKTPVKTKPAKAEPHAKAKRTGVKATARQIDERIGSLDEWRAATLAEVRRIVHEADPDIVEERKWIKPSNPAGVPVWSHAGIVCTGETYAQVVKLTFARGAALEDSRRLFNASLDGNTRRAIDIREGEAIDAKGLADLIRAAVAENLRSSATKSKKQPRASQPTPVKLLSGGNPQIPKGDGDAPVQAYIAAMPGWKSDLGRRLDALIVRSVPAVRKAVKWNSPFYGIQGQGWFLSFHVLTRYVKVTFFRGTSLAPVPPGAGKDKEARWIDIYEDDLLDEAQMAMWVKQAAAIPGWTP